jgi:hypothetical protein
MENLKIKKKYLAIFLIVFAVAFVSGVVLTNKDTALTYLRNMKETRENNISDAVYSITYLTDKICEIDYHTEKSSCYVEVEYTVVGNKQVDRVILSEFSSPEQDDETIKGHVLYAAESIVPAEEVLYVVSEVEGRKIELRTR